MKEHRTYVVFCKRGMRRDTCPNVLQSGEHCVECPYAGYIIREKRQNTEQSEETSENNKDVES